MIEERGAPRIEYRKAGDADVDALHAVFLAAEGELLGRHGFAWSSPPALEAMVPTFRHLLRHDGERCFVAEGAGRVVGYSAAFVRGDTWFLAALFIDPDCQGAGVGRRLLQLALAGAPKHRLTISDAIQPVSNALYAKHGLFPTTPILAFSGQPDHEMVSDVVASEVTPSSLALLDRVAYSYRWPNGRIGPLAGCDEASAAAALVAELARQPRSLVEIPGTSTSLVRVALEAGLHLLAPPGLLLLSDGVEPPRSLAISSYGLY